MDLNFFYRSFYHHRGKENELAVSLLFLVGFIFKLQSSKLRNTGRVFGLVGRYKDKVPSIECHFMGHSMVCHCMLVLWQCCSHPQGVSRMWNTNMCQWCLQTWQSWPSHFVPKCWPCLLLLNWLNLVCDGWRAPGAVPTEPVLLEGRFPYLSCTN